jgi:hypothetical protein
LASRLNKHGEAKERATLELAREYTDWRTEISGRAR